MIYTWATATNTGLVRDHNEDSVAPQDMGIEAGPFLVGVADGMGGHVAGEVASRLAIEAALEHGGDVVDRVQAANMAVIDTAAEDPSLRGMGTTLVLGWFADDAVEFGHVGDSRAYLLRSSNLEQITTDHNLVAEMVARGEISAGEAGTHPYRSVVTRALGLQPAVEIDRERRTLQSGDRVLICSDGLTNMVDGDTIRDILLEQSHPTDAVWTLIDAANEAGGIDNISVVVVSVNGDTEG
jgi:protein phosphatase